MAQCLWGLLLGYLIATWAESFFHHHIGHASPRVRAFWERHPRIGKPFLQAFYAHHIIHHARTFRRDFVTQFMDDEERQRLDAILPPDHKDEIIRNKYGVTITGTSTIWFVAPVMPFVPLLYLAFGPIVTLSAAVPMFIVYPMMSKWLHPLIHKAEEDLLHTCTPFEQWVMNTWYMKLVVIDHFLHHEYIMCNFNLLRGGDFIRRKHRSPGSKDVREMRRIGLIRSFS
jgi:hypothetical protein